MILTLHILIAVSTIIASTYAYFSPSKKLLKFSYVLAAGTLASGVGLVFIEPSQIAHVCITGIIYFTIVGIILQAAGRKLAKQQI